MATGKETFIALLKGFSDAGVDLDTRAAFGTPGFRIQIRNEMVDTGEVWSQTGGYTDVMCAAIGELFNQAADLTAIHTDVSNELSGLTDKVPIGGDILLGEDSTDNFSKIKISVSSLLSLVSIGNVFHTNIANEISALTAVTPTAADLLVIEDATAGFIKNKITIGDILALVPEPEIPDWLTPVGPILEETYEADYGELVTMKGP